ncbi:MAG: hypothetical protein MUC92_02630 [Fimbriimonadaceae bacterium]|jgi:hypothetical protein|nr:hypothetical protein [Fimbriimonadaceae bacterium]
MGPAGIVLLLTAGGLWGSSEERRFERLAAQDIASRLQGEGKKVSVNVRPNGIAAAWGEISLATITASHFSLEGLPLYTDPTRSRSGILSLLQLRLSNFTIRGLKVAQLEADIPYNRYDFGLARGSKQIRLSHSGVGTGWVRLDEAAIADWITKKFREIKRASVSISKDRITVSGFGEFLIATTDFKVEARVEHRDKTKLWLVEAKVLFGTEEADPFTTQTLLRILNPVVDLDRDLGLLDAVEITKIELHQGHLIARGKTKIPQEPAENKKE